MTAIVTDAHYRMSVSLIRDLADRGVRVVACEKASIKNPVGFASRGVLRCVRLPEDGYLDALLDLCREIAKRLGLEPVRLLRKTRNPPAQSTMADPAGRRANVSGAYEPERAARLDGRRVLLIDDIVTTGATLAECSRVLRTAGASDVVYAAFAAPRKQD